jgi:hypothetical protein
MFSLTLPRRMSALITATCLVPLLIAGFMTSQPAYADGPPPPDPNRIIICRTDPIVFLSDGTRVKMTADIGTAAENVQGIVYTLHAPVGTSVVRIVYTGAHVPETVDFFADRTAGTYDTDTVVSVAGNSAQSAVGVTATTVVNGRHRGAATGSAGDHLLVHIQE